MALSALDQVIAVDAHSSHPYFYKALVLDRMGNGTEARALMLRARQLEPTALQDQWELRVKRNCPNFAGLGDLLAGLRRMWAETEGAR